ncbi:MAG: DUF362 domain-containing protein [Bacteroidetes bacterium]|nr:DUF362 domain-containing protein [Bacteroidota bacterium]
MKPINRRKFIRRSISVGGISIGLSLMPKIIWANLLSAESDIYTITSENPKESIPVLIESLGGIESFVKPGNSVGFLVNSPWVHKGFYTNPDIVLVLMNMCKNAGASKIICYKPVRDGYWEESQYYEEMKPLIDEIVYGDERVEIDIKGGKEMQSAEVFKVFMESDVFINVPVAKHHNGTIYSGILKNLMGVSSRDTNRHMHSPDGEYTYSKTVYLSTCIADLNLIRKPDLSIIDAEVCAINNGPRGPGETTSPGLIIAGTNPLEMDAYASTLLGMEPDNIYTFTAAKELGLGKFDLDTIRVISL